MGPVYLWYSLVLDALGALLILGLALALFRRYLLRPEKLKTKRWDWLFPTWLLVIAVTGFFVEGSRIVYQEEPWRLWSPVGLGFGYFLQDLGLRGGGTEALPRRPCGGSMPRSSSAGSPGSPSTRR
jgi:hypothetical protein